MQWELDFLHMLESIHDGGIVDSIMILLSKLGDAGMLWIVIGILLCVPKATRRYGWQTLLAMLATFVVGNLILKNLFHRDRPYIVDPSLQILVPRPSEYSFPSGHTMNGFTAALTIFFMDKRAGIPALILATAIAFSRMYNLVHFPTDIIGGIVIGVCSATLVDYLYKKRLQNKESK